MILRSTLGISLLVALTIGSAARAGSASDLDQYFAQLEQQAELEGEIVLQKYGQSEFSQEVARSQSLAERGRYREAADILSALL